MSRLALILIPALCPVAALAHPGSHADAPMTHALTAPDHLAGLVALAVVVAGLALALARGRR